jgi:hypothetical protein
MKKLTFGGGPLQSIIPNIGMRQNRCYECSSVPRGQSRGLASPLTLRGEEFPNPGHRLSPADPRVQYFARRPDKVVCRLALYAIHPVDGAFPRFANLRPRDGEFFQKRSELILGSIATDAEEREILAGGLFVEGHHTMRVRSAWTTVRGPELEEQHPAAVFG